MGHLETIEGLEVAIATLLEKMPLFEFYAGIYFGVTLPSQSTALQSTLDSALPEFYAAIIVFAVKARTYFDTKGMSVICGVILLLLC